MEFDVVVVGSGPNGLAAAITLQQSGLSVLIIEGSAAIGGGLRSSDKLTLPGFTHDVCSAIHPLAAGSPFFQTLPLEEHGLRYIFPLIAAGHPFDDGTAALVNGSVQETAKLLGPDAEAYRDFIQPIVNDWPSMAADFLGPFTLSRKPLSMARFGWNALRSAREVGARFTTKQARGLWAGMCAHSIQNLTRPVTSGVGMVLLANAHLLGWPVPEGGSQRIANALSSYFLSLGGKIETGLFITSLDQLPSAKAVVFDITPRQLMEIAGHRFSSIYQWQLNRYRYGWGVFKVDWALDGPTPFKAPELANAGTVHLGGTFEEIEFSEREISKGRHPEKPFVLFAQQSLFDRSRAPEGKQTAWAYCHVPADSTMNMQRVIEGQIERFAPGFRDRIIGSHSLNTAQMESYNPNYIGGDINGGALTATQLFTRPALRLSPYKTSAKGIYICSSSTPPGGGVHGMCGYHAAKKLLSDIFKIKLPRLPDLQ